MAAGKKKIDRTKWGGGDKQYFKWKKKMQKKNPNFFKKRA